MTGKELQDWRHRLGWTQAAAASQLGITPQHYRKLESGKIELRPVFRLACERLEMDSEKC